MQDEPGELTCEQVAMFLRDLWGLAPVTVTYAPVGFGSHHWIAADRDGPRWFVTASYLDPEGDWVAPTAEGIAAGLTAAATAVRELADRGHRFALTPLPDRTGALVLRIRPAWVLQVFPYLAGWSTGDGEWTDPAERRQVAGILGELHAAEPPRSLRSWDFAVPSRSALAREGAWSGGPYAEPARELIAGTRTALAAAFDHYDALVREIKVDPQPLVMTHGEPHSANVIRTDDHQMCLIDWGTVRLAPRERDLAALGPDLTDVLPAYQQAAGPVVPRPAALELFHEWWALAEICGYVRRFRRPHRDSADSATSWQLLRKYVAMAIG